MRQWPSSASPAAASAPRKRGSYILGYACGNDVSERAWQKDDWTFWRAKGSDTFAPVGPWIETDINPQALEMIVRLNGEEVQHGHTEEMLFTFTEIVSYISQQITLQPGDPDFLRLHRSYHRPQERRPGGGGDSGHRRGCPTRWCGEKA